MMVIYFKALKINGLIPLLGRIFSSYLQSETGDSGSPELFEIRKGCGVNVWRTTQVVGSEPWCDIHLSDRRTSKW